jgi:hypothetical protein
MGRGQAVPYTAAVHETGWYQDPYGVHEDRWITDGVPTPLVRDGDVESRDPPPERSVVGRDLVISERPYGSSGPGDMVRADDAEANPRSSIEVVLDSLPKDAPVI